MSDLGGLAKYRNDGPMSAGCEAQYVPPTMRQQLERKKANLEAQLEKVNKGLEALNSSQEVEKVLDSVLNAL